MRQERGQEVSGRERACRQAAVLSWVVREALHEKVCYLSKDQKEKEKE